MEIFIFDKFAIQNPKSKINTGGFNHDEKI
jgi:hypothetical protein